ncbi:MAG: VWA domain-containing protein [Pseudomonadota bacterium]
MIVFDGSGSMAEMGFNKIDVPRILEARSAVARAMPEIATQRHIGLLIYGPNGPDGCTGIDLRFAPIPDAAQQVIHAVNGLEPAGETPLTASVNEAVKVLDARAGSGLVVLVTDGKETCGGSPCQLAAQLAGGAYTVHVIGFKVRGEYFAFSNDDDNEYDNAESVARCLADRTGGVYVGAENVEELIAAFHKTLGCRLLF